MDDSEEDKIARLRRLIDDARSAVIFTGAGISTGSGIPDFRSPGGIWTKHRPIEFGDFVASADMRREAWRRKFAVDDATRGAAPNAAHLAVARLAREGKVSLVVTQNIDGLHGASGVPADRLVELHGNGTYAHCLDCGLRHELSEVREAFEATGDPPDCRRCGGLVKSATISFGQAMPVEAMMRAQAASEDADLFLVLGSSLVVYPAAGLPIVAKRAGARLVIANREPTELDPIADLLIRTGLVALFGRYENGP